MYACVSGMRVPYTPEPDMYVRCWLNVIVVMEEISRDTSHQYEHERDEYEWNGFPVWLSPNQFYICIRICRTRGVSNKGSLIFSSFLVALHGTPPPSDVSFDRGIHRRGARKRGRLATVFQSPAPAPVPGRFECHVLLNILQ